jgi:hypothetical protein
MTTSTARVLGALALTAVACGKSVDELARDVRLCGDTTAASVIATCLVEQRGWKPGAADSAAALRARELDSIIRWRAESAWAASGAERQPQLERCVRAYGDVAACLRLAGWPADRAQRTADSAWNRRAAEHQRHVERCVRQSSGRSNIADCLMLLYRWPTGRALAANDSVQRARAAR